VRRGLLIVGAVLCVCGLQRDITVFDLLTFQGGFSYSYDFMADNEGPVDVSAPTNTLHAVIVIIFSTTHVFK
jgi:hypothetical protein